MDELKSCPFCGKMPSLGKVRFGMEKDYRYTLHCDECAYNIGWLETENEAVEKWNRRAEPIVRCKQCKQWDDSIEGRYVGGWCFCDRLQISTSPAWFCADWEAKNEERRAER